MEVHHLLVDFSVVVPGVGENVVALEIEDDELVLHHAMLCLLNSGQITLHALPELVQDF